MGVVVVTHRSRRRPIPGAGAKLRAPSIHWPPSHFLNAIERLQAKALAEGKQCIRSAGTFAVGQSCLGARTSILKAGARWRSWVSNVRAVAVAIGCMSVAANDTTSDALNADRSGFCSFAHCRRQRPSRSSRTYFPQRGRIRRKLPSANATVAYRCGRPHRSGYAPSELQLFDDHLANIFHRCVRRTGEFYMASRPR
jgi:hypothetical protein